jgi:small ligand-binding sensory domain FIST
MKWASAASDNPSLDEALDRCVESLKEQLGGDEADLAVVFVSAHHGQGYDEIPRLVQQRLKVKNLVGCSAGGVIGGGHEIEQRPGLSVTAAVLPGVEMSPFHISDEGMPDLDASPDKWHAATRTSPDKKPQFLLLTDPFSIRSENLILGLDYAFDGAVKIGGMASGGRQQGGTALFLGERVYHDGAVGVAFHGDVVIDPIVAQGCRPVGKPMRITKGQNNILLELDGKPTLEALQTVYRGMSERDQQLARHSLFLGICMDEFQEEPKQGDFLIRNIVGMEPKLGALAIGEMLREGQIVQFHLRDAHTSAEDLSQMLRRYSEGGGAAQATGALLFSCLGRGRYLYGRPDHDTDLFRGVVGNVPLGGFFCNGEIGPVGGVTYLHGYTSSFGIFRPKERRETEG